MITLEKSTNIHYPMLTMEQVLKPEIFNDIIELQVQIRSDNKPALLVRFKQLKIVNINLAWVDTDDIWYSLKQLDKLLHYKIARGFTY